MDGHQDVPGEDRHPEHRHPGCAHADHGGDHVDPAEDGAQTGDGQAHDPQVAAGAGRVDGVGQRGVGGPAEVGGAARGDEPGRAHRGAEQEQPEREGVQPRERHVGRADLQRQHQVGEAEHDRGRVEQQHDRAVHGEQLVELLVRQELQTGRGQLGAHQQRHQAADEEEDHAGDAVHDADHLVIGGGDQLVDQVPFGTHPRRERTDGLEFSQRGRFGCQQLLQTSSPGQGPKGAGTQYFRNLSPRSGRAAGLVLQTVVNAPPVPPRRFGAAFRAAGCYRRTRADRRDCDPRLAAAR